MLKIENLLRVTDQNQKLPSLSLDMSLQPETNKLEKKMKTQFNFSLCQPLLLLTCKEGGGGSLSPQSPRNTLRTSGASAFKAPSNRSISPPPFLSFFVSLWLSLSPPFSNESVHMPEHVCWTTGTHLNNGFHLLWLVAACVSCLPDRKDGIQQWNQWGHERNKVGVSKGWAP